MVESFGAKAKIIVAVFIALFMTGCGIEFETDIQDGTAVNENNISIVFSAKDKSAKLLLATKKRKLFVNEEQRTQDTKVAHRRPRDKEPLQIIYKPAPTRLLPEGNVTISLHVPYKRRRLFERIFGISEAQKSVTIFVDTLPPRIQAQEPEANSTITDDQTILRFRAYDAGIGIDPDSLECYVADSNWTARCSMQSDVIALAPDSDHRLPMGRFRVTLFIADKLGNRGAYEFFYEGRYDTTPPTIILQNPQPGSVIVDPLQKLTFSIKDDENGTGVDPESVTLRFVEENRTVALVHEGNETDIYTYTPDEEHPLPYGNIEMEVNASDRAGNSAGATFSIFLRQKETLSAVPVAVPSSAPAPATIRFYPRVTTDTAIIHYYWDMDGDGNYEISNLFPDSTSRTYNVPGDYVVGLKVVDANNKVAEGNVTVHITNEPPRVRVDLEPSNGSVPLTVYFHVTVNDNEGIAKYEWDFDGDGVWDYESTETGDTQYTYTKTGVYSAKLRVTDTRGATAIYSAPTTTVRASEEGAPTVQALVTPQEGVAPLRVVLDANATDPQDKGFVSYRWDFDGDGTWDYNSTQTPRVEHTYTAAGTFYPTIEARTGDGRVAVDSTSIRVHQQVTLSVDTDTIDPELGESATIHTKLAADAQVQIVIEDRAGNPVRILVPWSQRAAGEYDDVWDGRAEDGIELKEGPYYAVIYYKEDGKIKKLDLRESTGGARHSMSRSTAPYTFAPFDNRPVRITFTLPRAGEVVSFMGYTDSNTRIITFRNRQPLGRGSYTDIWYSQNDDGALVTPPPYRYFLYGAWWYSMPDNTIYVKGGVHIGDVQVAPPIFVPSSHEDGGKPKTLKITFDLTRSATVELVIFDADSGTVAATREYANLPAGTNTIEYDGRDNHGVRLKPGRYTLGVRAVDERGYRSLMRYQVMRIAY